MTFLDSPPQEPTVWETGFLDDLKVLAQFYIRRFFLNKKAPNGMPIDPTFVTGKAYVMRVLNTDICNGIGQVYDCLRKQRDGKVVGEPSDMARIEIEEIKAVLQIQRECAKLGIPKCFSAGITMMYYELCEGVEF
jgi:hypothetical protein